MSTQQNAQGGQQAGQAADSGLWAKGSEKVKGTRPEKLLRCMRGFNIVLAAAVMIVGGSTIAAIQGCSGACSSISFGVVAFNIIAFALLLFLYELRVGNRSKTFIEKNFGFLYAHRGKAMLLIFIGTLCFSAISTNFDRWIWNLLVGIAATLNGIFLCLVYYFHPTFREVDLRPKAKGLGGVPVQRDNTANGDANQGTNTGTNAGYQFGEENIGPAYGRYNESPFVISESSPQPPPMGENPYGEVGTSTAGMPFATSGSTTVEMGQPSGGTTTTDTNPFQSNDNPFAEDTDQRV